MQDPRDSRRIAKACVLALGLGIAGTACGDARADGWSDRIEIHGYFSSTARFIVPQLDVSDAVQLSAWQQQLNIETTAEIFSNEDWNVGAVMILRPTYDLAYDLYPNLYGKRAQSGAAGTELGLGFTRNPDGFRHGDRVPGAGDGIDGAFRYVNQDIQFLFTGTNSPGLVIDDRVFFGQFVAPVAPRGSNQVRLGGAPNVAGFMRGPAFALSTSLQGSVAAATQPPGTPLRSPGQIAAGLPALGDRRSLEQAPFGVNETQGKLQTSCFDNANPWCLLRELYLDVERRDTLVRIGKQQIVWGKTDAFRMQDIINPLDLGTASIFLPLEDRRIPQWAVDVVHSFGDVGPVEDLSLELVWVVDRFAPTQIGQCGEARAFLAACASRANAAAHGLFGLALAEVEEREWTLRNTEPGFRFEGRFPEPSISWSFSGFWGIQDTPVLKLANAYSFTNPNPGAMLFLQGLSVPQQVNASTGGALAALFPSFLGGFDPYDPAAIQATAGEIRTLWTTFFGNGGLLCDASTAASASAQAACITASQLQLLALPFSGGQIVLEYPRTLTLGASLDYQVPGADAIVNFEMAYDVERKIISSAQEDLIDSSGVVAAAIGVDWSPFLPWINRERTSLVGAQLFVEHILDYDDDGQGRRMLPDETQVLSTFFMQNYWRNDSVILTNFLAWDWNAQAVAWGPSLRWILNESLFLELGAQMIWSKPQRSPLRNTCGGDLTTACLSDPANFQAGAFQTINANFSRTAEGPLFIQQSFGDHLEEDRDTIFFSVTYQF